MFKRPLITSALIAALALPTYAHKHTGGIQAKENKKILAPFDIVHTKITTKDNIATFHMAVSGKAGESKPTPTGKLAGSAVFSYVWPTHWIAMK